MPPPRSVNGTPRNDGARKSSSDGQMQFDGFFCETAHAAASDAPAAPRRVEARTPLRHNEDQPSEAMLRAACEAILREAAARGLVPAAIPWDQALTLAETWRALAHAAVIAAWAARK